MKVVNREERAAHDSAVLLGGVKGLAIGAVASLGIYALARFRYPAISRLGASAKTAIYVTPPAFMASLTAELGSNNFDHSMYSSEASQKKLLEEHKKWAALSTKEKTIFTLNENKYKIITGLWALSLWGSWAWVSRDKLLTKAQKFYDARMYAQFITIILLLGSIGLSIQEEKSGLAKKKLKPDDEYLSEMMQSSK
ncbi:DEKNAAC102311 [Brettanomyces naardenensis]|uniref:DEKNAAC102311 n=1 Tax=Brettanomyces naardenensis TaxID=13370 RepID=A0A448YKC6_BRENA|nr:DEKNAAC102311 [Brettanomyces naardenensis]